MQFLPSPGQPPPGSNVISFVISQAQSSLLLSLRAPPTGLYTGPITPQCFRPVPSALRFLPVRPLKSTVRDHVTLTVRDRAARIFIQHRACHVTGGMDEHTSTLCRLRAGAPNASIQELEDKRTSRGLPWSPSQEHSEGSVLRPTGSSRALLQSTQT